MRELLKKKNSYIWTEAHQSEFELVKSALCADGTLKPFIHEWKTVLHTDFSKVGIGLVLSQINPKDNTDKRLIWASSMKHNSKRDSLLPPLYGEILAIVRSIKACNFWLRGNQHFEVATDHKCLETIFNRNELGSEMDEYVILQILSIQNYNFSIQYIKGKLNSLADFMSRKPKWSDNINTIGKGKENDELNEHASDILRVTTRSMREDIFMTEFYDAMVSDTQYMTLMHLVQAGTTKEEARNLDVDIKEYVPDWDLIGLLEDNNKTLLTYKGTRLIPPKNYRSRLLAILHIPHLGLS
jgi:hypothetical protein